MIERGIDLSGPVCFRKALSAGSLFEGQSCKASRLHAGNLHKPAIFRTDSGQLFTVSGKPASLFVLESFYRHDAFARKAAVVHNGHGGSLVSGQNLQGIFLDGIQNLVGFRILCRGILIYFMDGGTGDDVMELVSESDFPGLMKLLCRIGRKIAVFYSCLTGQPFCLAKLQFGLPVVLFIPGLGGIGTSVVLQIKFSIPGWYMTVGFGNGLLEIFKVVVSFSRSYSRKTRHRFQMTAHLQHVTIDSAAAVSVSISQKKLLIDLFVMIKIPFSLDRYRIDHTIIGISAAVRNSRRTHEMSQDLGTIHSDPAEGVMRHVVVLVPADLDGHEIVNAGTFQDLGQCPAVAEYIRKPEHIGNCTKFLLEETLTIQDLTYQSLTGRDVAVCFHPHGTVWLPVAGSYRFPDPLINVRIVGFDIIIKLRLRLDKGKLRILLHQRTHGRKCTGCFFSGVFQLPQPGYVDVGMTYGVNGHRAGVGNFGNLLVPDRKCFFQRLIKGIGTRLSPVDRQMRPVDGCQQFPSHRIILIQHTYRLDGCAAAVIEIIRSLIQDCKLRLFELMGLRGWHTSALQPCPETDGKIHPGPCQFRREDHFFMIRTGLAVRRTVDIDQPLKTGVQSVTCFSDIKQAGNLLSRPFCRNIHGLADPHIGSSSDPEISFLQAARINDTLRPLSHRFFLRCACFKYRDLHPFSVAEILQFFCAPLQLFQCKKHTFPPFLPVSHLFLLYYKVPYLTCQYMFYINMISFFRCVAW